VQIGVLIAIFKKNLSEIGKVLVWLTNIIKFDRLFSIL
jgi:hypothetical protein